jgi:hypothetical protein
MGNRRLANPRFWGIPILEKGDFGASPFLEVPFLGHRPFRKCRFWGIEIGLRQQKGSGCRSVKSDYPLHWNGFSAILPGSETPENEKKPANPAHEMPILPSLCHGILPESYRNCPFRVSDNTSYLTFPLE